MNQLKIYRIWVLMITSFGIHAEVLKDGTVIPVRLAENVNGNMNFTGESVYFQTTEDVMVNSKLLIKSGTFVNGFVSEAVGRKSLGKGGELTLMPRSLKTTNGDIVKFEKIPLSQEGRKRTGATVAHVVMWGPLGLFAKGRAAFMFKGTEFDIVVDGDYNLEVFKPKSSSIQKKKEFSVYFKEYKKKINYRKGKSGKDFTVMVSSSDDFNVKEVKISHVDGYELPKAIKPIDFKINKKDINQTELTFAFKDIIKYAMPNSSTFVFVSGDKYQSEAQLNTEWKLK